MSARGARGSRTSAKVRPGSAPGGGNSSKYGMPPEDETSDEDEEAAPSGPVQVVVKRPTSAMARAASQASVGGYGKRTLMTRPDGPPKYTAVLRCGVKGPRYGDPPGPFSWHASLEWEEIELWDAYANTPAKSLRDVLRTAATHFASQWDAHDDGEYAYRSTLAYSVADAATSGSSARNSASTALPLGFDSRLFYWQEEQYQTGTPQDLATATTIQAVKHVEMAARPKSAPARGGRKSPAGGEEEAFPPPGGKTGTDLLRRSRDSGESVPAADQAPASALRKGGLVRPSTAKPGGAGGGNKRRIAFATEVDEDRLLIKSGNKGRGGYAGGAPKAAAPAPSPAPAPAAPAPAPAAPAPAPAAPAPAPAAPPPIAAPAPSGVETGAPFATLEAQEAKAAVAEMEGEMGGALDMGAMEAAPQ